VKGKASICLCQGKQTILSLSWKGNISIYVKENKRFDVPIRESKQFYLLVRERIFLSGKVIFRSASVSERKRFSVREKETFLSLPGKRNIKI
jgi:hypothetical protein